MIWLFSDILAGLGGIETYLDALARTLYSEGRPFKVAVSLNGPTRVLDDLEALGINVYRQKHIPGDRFQIRQRLLIRHVAKQLRPGDWVYCIRQPMPQIYLPLVRAAHKRGAKVAASWIFTPDFLPPPAGSVGTKFCQAVAETDAVVSVSHAGKPRYREVYGYNGEVKVVRYHNRSLFDAPVPMPPGPPYAIGFMGRIDVYQKNLDTILTAFAALRAQRSDVVLNIYGGGPDEERFKAMVSKANLGDAVQVHGRYQHDRDLPHIIGDNHLFVYTSRFEGGPCFALLELMQAGRYVVASPVGGIPDLYEGRPDLGLLTRPDDPKAIEEAFNQALQRISQGRIDGYHIRKVYQESLSNEVAHKQFMEILS